MLCGCNIWAFSMSPGGLQDHVGFLVLCRGHVSCILQIINYTAVEEVYGGNFEKKTRTACGITTTNKAQWLKAHKHEPRLFQVRTRSIFFYLSATPPTTNYVRALRPSRSTAIIARRATHEAHKGCKRGLEGLHTWSAGHFAAV